MKALCGALLCLRLASASSVSATLRRWLQQGEAEAYQGPSNCHRTGGGHVPYFDNCIGCDFVAAQECIAQLRSNAAGNVPSNCDMEKVAHRAFWPQRDCCPRIDDGDVDADTAAYPAALRCLADVYCGDSWLYRSLQDECIAQGCTPTRQACEPLESAAGMTLPTASLLLGLSILSTASTLCFASTNA